MREGEEYKCGPAQMNQPDPDFGISTASPLDVWFAQVKKQAVGQDIELLSHANLYYPALVTCLVGCTCSYHTLVRLSNLVKPDHKFFCTTARCLVIILVRLTNLYKYAHQKLHDQQCTFRIYKPARQNIQTCTIILINHQQYSFSHITGPTNPHKSSQNEKLQCNFSSK
jgi:hypothetical protein